MQKMPPVEMPMRLKPLTDTLPNFLTPICQWFCSICIHPDPLSPLSRRNNKGGLFCCMGFELPTAYSRHLWTLGEEALLQTI